MYTKTTDDITVIVQPFYLAEQSEPDSNDYVWAYHVSIENRRPDPVTLVRRHWRITNALGRIEEVSGDGVVGEQPTIPPGCVFEYTSGTPLNTPSGIMNGIYQMTDAKGDVFHVDIPTFSLDSPYQSQQVH
jgi:ApaG protein